jgi:hypothetical protein
VTAELAAQLQATVEQLEGYRQTLGSTIAALDALFADNSQATTLANDSTEHGGQAAAIQQALNADAAMLQASGQQFSAAVESLHAQVNQSLSQLQAQDGAWDQGYGTLQTGLGALDHAGDQAGTQSTAALTGVQSKLQDAQQTTQAQLQQFDAAGQVLNADLTTNVQPAVTNVTQTFQTTVSGPQTAQSTEQLATTYTQIDSSLDSCLQTGGDANQAFQSTVSDSAQTLISTIAADVNDPITAAAQDLTGGTLDEVTQSVTASVSTIQAGADVASALSGTAPQAQDLKNSADDIKQAITVSQSGMSGNGDSS